MENLSDEELMLNYQRGSEEAFKILYQRHSGKVYGFIYKKTHSKELAMDLTQDVFLKIHRNRSNYKSEHTFLAWIFTITHSVCIDGLRRQKRRKHNLHGEEGLEQLATEAQIPVRQDFEQALAALPEVQQQAVRLRYYEDKDFDEIALSLSTSSENARQILSRGVRAMKNFFKKEMQSE